VPRLIKYLSIVFMVSPGLSAQSFSAGLPYALLGSPVRDFPLIPTSPGELQDLDLSRELERFISAREIARRIALHHARVAALRAEIRFAYTSPDKAPPGSEVAAKPKKRRHFGRSR
jgi:hypothetical protein